MRCIDCKHWGKQQKRHGSRFLRLNRLTDAEKARGYVGELSYTFEKVPRATCEHPLVDRSGGKPLIVHANSGAGCECFEEAIKEAL
jgi:hypothetical protein